MRKGTRLKLKIVERGETQEWLARQTGIPANTISRVANGQWPSLKHALKIARALEVPVESLWSLDDEEAQG